MSPATRLARLLFFSRGRSRRFSPAAEAAARAKRARDHLERQRARERRRRERERRSGELAFAAAWLHAGLAPLMFVGALALGGLLAQTATEPILLRGVVLERIAIQGARSLDVAALASHAGLVAGRPLSSIDPHVVQDVFAGDPWVESVRALRLPTGTLLIGVAEREAVARWQRHANDPVSLVDRNGMRFDGRLEDGPDLPLVLGGDADDGVLPAEAIALIDQVLAHASLARDPSAITLRVPDPQATAASDGTGPEAASGYVLQVGAEGPRALLGDTQLSQRLARLAVLLDRQETPIADARWIDLRYADRAVLRTEPASG